MPGRRGWAVGVTGFGGALPPDERIEANAVRDAAGVPAGFPAFGQESVYSVPLR
ncbi:MAG TPA: hypothetical protein VFO01_11945 [Trebonia sp.]|nr:hypothetical protein [Trebonia sp.]